MLYLLTFLSLFITATLATLPRSPYGKEDSLKNHPLTKFHRELQSSPKRSMITNFEQGNTFVLANSFANKDCNSDGGQLFESVAFLSGYCIISGSTSQRWTCDSSSVHIEEFDAADCDDSHRSVDSYINIGQCFSTNTTDTTVYNAVSYSCGSSYTPKGSWYSSLYFSDSGCKNPVEAVSILNGYCLSPDQKMSYKYDYPKESYYFSNADCTGAVTTFDISSSANVCFPVSASSSLNSYETLFVKN